MNITDIVIAKALAGGGGGGGGGGGDFSTAKVTFTNTSLTDNCLVYIPNYYYDEEYEEGGAEYSFLVSPGDSQTIDMILYKGTGVFEIPFGTVNATTGGIEVFSGYGTVTGDGTVNVTGLNPIQLFYVGELTVTTNQQLFIAGGIYVDSFGSKTSISVESNDTKTVKLFGVGNTVIIYPIYPSIYSVNYALSGNARLLNDGVEISGDATVTITLT